MLMAQGRPTSGLAVSLRILGVFMLRNSITGRAIRQVIAFPALALFLSVASVEPASAQTGASHMGRTSISVNHSETVSVPEGYAEVIVGSADIADVLPLSDRTIYVLGKQIGTTNVSIFDAQKRLLGVMDIEVTPNFSFVQSRIRAAAPGASNISVSYIDGQLILDGNVPDGVTAERAVTIAQSFSRAPVINALQIDTPQQVLLEVRVLEVSRDGGRELGVNWAGSQRNGVGGAAVGRGDLVAGGVNGNNFLNVPLGSGQFPFGVLFGNLLRTSGISIDVAIQALEGRGLARRLAEPNLTALSGSSASFLAGGEFPVPVAAETSAGTASTTIEFKEFGVKLDFTPTVLADRTINLKLTPEVSQLDFTNAVRSANITIPALITRRASTEIELRDGQSFAMAGLLQTELRELSNQVPWLGSIPVLGALFSSKSYQQRESELVIIVTAHLARPGIPGARPVSPLDSHLPANDADFFIGGQFELKKSYQHYVETGGAVRGPYGHMLDIFAAPGVAAGAGAIVKY
jgi:pilus assembly protein CpaC